MSVLRSRLASRALRRAAQLILLICGGTISVRAQDPSDSASIAPGIRVPARFVGASRAVIDSLDVARSSAATFSELLQARAASVSVMMSGGTLTDGGRLLIRGPSTVGTSGAPLLIVDGVRMDEQEDDSTGAASRLDDIELDDIATVEVLRGPAAATLFGAGASSGVIVVTTKRATTRGWHAGGRVLVDGRQSRTTLSDNYWTTGSNAQGQPTSFCSLANVGTGGCTPGARVQWNPLASSSVVRTGSGGRAAYAIAGGSSSSRARLSISGRYANGMATDDRLSQVNTRLSVNQRVVGGLELDAVVGHLWSTATRSNLGDVILSALRDPLRMDSVASFSTRSENRLRDPLEQRMRHLSGQASATWRRGEWLTLRAAITRDRVDADASRRTPGYTWDYASVQGGQITQSHELLGERSASRGSMELAHELFGVPGVEGRLVLGTERTVRGRIVADSNAYANGWSTYRSWGSVVNNAVFALGRISVGERVAFGVGVRHERDHMADSVFRVFPSADATWTVGRAAGGVARLRAAYGESVQPFALFTAPVVPLELITYYPMPQSSIEIPERMRELEGGADIDWGPRGSVEITAYRRRIENLFIAPIGRYFGDSRRGASHGVELDARAAVYRGRSAAWELRAIGAANRSRIVDGPKVFGAAREIYQEGAPFAAVPGAAPTFADANGDGIIAPSEFKRRAFDEDLRPSTPTLEVALHSLVSIGRRLSILAIVDRRSGQLAFPYSEWMHCGQPNCRAGQDPTAPLADQAFVHDLMSGLAFTDASFTRLRELSLRWRIGGRDAARGWRDATLVVAGRDLALWTSWRGLDPEINTNPRSALLQSDNRGVPLPRRVTIGLELGGGAP